MQHSFPEGYFHHYDSPAGTIFMAATEEGICNLKFAGEQSKEDHFIPVDINTLHPFLQQLISELDNYFEGKLKSFTVPLDPQGTGFQKKVWHTVAEIPYGETTSYAKLSQQLNQPDAIRAVANANARNPLLLLIPCHRVIGTNGDLNGYAAGLPRKKYLLELEGALQQLSLPF